MIIGVDLWSEDTRLQRLNGYSSFNFKHRYHELSEFSFSISGVYAEALRAYQTIHLVEKIGSEVIYHTGMIDSIEEDSQLFDVLKVKGVGYGKFNKRVSIVGLGTGDGYDKQTDTPVNCMRHYVDANCITTSTKRKVNGLTLGNATVTNVTNYTFEFRGDYIKDVLSEISFATLVGWDVKYRSGLYYFDIFEGSVVDNLVFSRTSGTLEQLKIITDVSTYANAVYVFAEGEGATRTIQEIDDLSEGIYRDEMVLSVSKDDSLEEKGNAALNELKEIVTIEATPRENNFTYGIDFNIGDIIKISEKGRLYETRLIEVEDIFENGMWSKKFIVGKKKQSFSALYKQERKNFWHLARR